MKLLTCVAAAGVLAAGSQAFAQDDAAAQIQELKAKLKQLEQRVDDEARKQRQMEAQARTAAPAYKAGPAFDPCPAGKVCYKEVTLTFGGWVDLTDIYRTRNLASDTGSVYNFIPFRQAKNFSTPESRFSARQTRFSLLAEGNVDAETHLAGFGEIDFEGAAQTANSVATNSFNPRMRQLSLEIDRSDLGFHVLAGQSWSLNAPSRIGIDRAPSMRPASSISNPSPASSPPGSPAFASGRTSGRSSSSRSRPKIRRPRSSAAMCPRSGRPRWGRRACSTRICWST
jgi:hypothetical protein